MSGFTPEQIIALAPDPGSAKAGKELASPRKWVSLGHNEQAAWGECQGSAKVPYQTQIDLSEPAFKCSCPSRKFPCKHALGLFLLLASQPASFSGSQPPGWVSEWLAKRALARATQNDGRAVGAHSRAPTTTSATSNTEEEAPAQTVTAARRAAKREDRVRQGLVDLDLWLCDLVRQGLNSVQAKPQSFWETPAARLVDAQAPGLARKVRDMAGLPGSGDGWQGRLLAQAGALHLLVEGYQHLEQLPEPTQEDIRTQIGWTQDQDELLKQAGTRDEWLVLGKRVEEETLGKLGRSSVLRVQRTWLWGKQTRRPALVLSFAAPGQVLDAALLPGTRLEAELVYFPSGFPLRALIKKKMTPPTPDRTLPGFSSLLEANKAYAAALTANPWLELFPMPLCGFIPVKAGEVWGVRDATGHFAPFEAGFSQAWTLVALSGGNPLDLFGEWNGSALWPVSICAERRFILLLARLA